MRASIAALICVLLLLALPAAGDAAPPPPEEVHVLVRGSHGYGVQVDGTVKRGRSTVTITAGRPFESAAYSTAGTVTSDRLAANFGRLGVVDLRFSDARDHQIRVPRGCRSAGTLKVATVRTGTFTGTSRFRGEQDFTAVSTPRARGAVGDPVALLISSLPSSDQNAHVICLHSSGGPAGDDEPTDAALLHVTGPHGHLSLEAISQIADSSSTSPAAPEDQGVAEILAFDSEQRGRVAIARTVIMPAPAADFVIAGNLGAATLAPPPPFTGRGEFRRDPDGTTSWSGSLTVPFPGLADVPLAGPGFTASLSLGSNP
jgi:hypothetical protein